MYGWRARVGHVAPSRGDTLVYEFYRMLPAGFMILNSTGTIRQLVDADLERQLERIDEAIPCPEVVPPWLRLRGAPGEVDTNPSDPRCRHHRRLLVRVAIELDGDAEIVAGILGHGRKHRQERQNSR